MEPEAANAVEAESPRDGDSRAPTGNGAAHCEAMLPKIASSSSDCRFSAGLIPTATALHCRLVSSCHSRLWSVLSLPGSEPGKKSGGPAATEAQGPAPPLDGVPR